MKTVHVLIENLGIEILVCNFSYYGKLTSYHRKTFDFQNIMPKFILRVIKIILSFLENYAWNIFIYSSLTIFSNKIHFKY